MNARMNQPAVRLVATAALVALTACSGGGSGSSGSGAAGASPQPTNSIGFPLFAGASVLSNHDFKQAVTSNEAQSNALLSQGAGTYLGHDVVAGTQAAMPALETWLAQLNAKPPDGYSVAITGSGMDVVHERTKAMGIDFAVFKGTQNGKVHDVVVVAVDPETLDAKAGGVLGMVSKYKMLPQSLRDPIDQQAKERTGYTVTEMTQPDTPIGAVVNALAELKDFGGRGVILIDASKQ